MQFTIFINFILVQNQMLSNWHWKVIDPPIRTERMDSSENKIKIVRMILHIVLNLSKQPPLAVKKTLENLQVGKSQHEDPSQLSHAGEDDEIHRGRCNDGDHPEGQDTDGSLPVHTAGSPPARSDPGHGDCVAGTAAHILFTMKH